MNFIGALWHYMFSSVPLLLGFVLQSVTSDLRRSSPLACAVAPRLLSHAASAALVASHRRYRA